MKLCVCEKPELARNVVEAIKLLGETPVYNRSTGAYRSENYIICAARGHLFELYSIEEYRPDYDASKKYPWSLDELPFRPNPFRFHLKEEDKGKKGYISNKQRFEIIRSFIQSDEVDMIIHCGDKDREGEILIRIILGMAHNKKPVMRPWYNSQEAIDIRDALQNMNPDSNYDSIASAGFARMYMDWAYGINATRYVTKKSGTLCHIGRVLGAIIRAIYDRDMEIKNFVPEAFYGLCAKTCLHGVDITLRSKKTVPRNDESVIKAMAKNYSNWDSIVTKVIGKEKEIKRPKLFSQTTLQNVLSKRHKMTPSEVLANTQSLYEKKLVTYPRTHSEYLAETEKERIQDILKSLSAAGIHGATFIDSKNVFDNDKIDGESHSAITPTRNIPSAEVLNKLSDSEKKIYLTILYRFMATFCNEAYEVMVSQVTICVGDKEAGGEEFTIEGKQTLMEGWTRFEPAPKDKEIPCCKVGDAFKLPFVPEERSTQPPAHYTIVTLNNFLENPFKNDNNEDSGPDYEALKKGLEIGTTATRSGIIENCIKRGYINLNKDIYTVTEKGINLCNIADRLGLDMGKEQTVSFQRYITKVANREASTKEAVDYTYQVLEKVISKNKNTKFDSNSEQGYNSAPPKGPERQRSQFEQHTVGICPRCQSSIIERSKSFSCSNRNCSFTMWKRNKFLDALQVEIDVKRAVGLLSNGKIFIAKLWSEKKKKHFSGYLIMVDTYDKENPEKKAYVNYELKLKERDYSSRRKRSPIKNRQRLITGG